MTTKYVVAIWTGFVALLTALGALLYRKGRDDERTELDQADSNRANQILSADPEEMTDEERKKKGWIR